MKTWSLRLRLLALAALGISLVLGLAGFGFSWLYRQHVEKFVLTELTMHSDQLLANVSVSSKGAVIVGATLSDPRFEQPGGGLYWQIDQAGEKSLRSRSLWDESIVIPTPPTSTEENHAHILQLASGGEIFALEKLIIASNDLGIEKKLVVTVGIDRERITSPISDFSKALILGLALTYAGLLASTLAIITLGLRPLQEVKRGIALLRSGSMKFDSSRLPSEVTPLADEVNALVEARELQIENARKRASNLAHGLKTPLAVMIAASNDLRAQGQPAAAGHIALNALQMRDLVERELTRSRMAHSDNARRTDLAEVCAKVVMTMKKAPRGDLLIWSQNLPASCSVAMDRVDLMELLGNLLDNARKNASELVRISHDNKTLVVEDDGVGVSDAQLPQILLRGVQLDEKKSGSGIGLAIVSDLSEAYGLTLAVRRSELGGLAVEVGMPSV